MLQNYGISKGLTIHGLTLGSKVFIEDFNGSAPLNTFGADNDIAIDVRTLEHYLKTAGVWNKTNIASIITKLTLANINNIVVDNIIFADIHTVIWEIEVTNGVSYYTTTIKALTDGITIDFIQHGNMQLGIDIPGLDFTVGLSLTEIELTINSTNPINAKILRIAI